MCMCVLVTNFTMRMCFGLLCVVCMRVLVSVQLPEVHSVCMCVGACVCECLCGYLKFTMCVCV